MSEVGETLAAPHRAIEIANDRERFLVDLFDALWIEFRTQVSFVRKYEEVVSAHRGAFFNDHIAFRTLGWQQPQLGIATLSRPFEALGYLPANCYQFPDKHLRSIHFQHANPKLPKLFITELHSWMLSADAVSGLSRSLESHTPVLADDVLFELARIEKAPAARRAELLMLLKNWFTKPQWQPPTKQTVLDLNSESQFAAWVLVHGYRVNHFTALVNSHGTPAMDDIDKTVAEMQAAGIPMKTDIEGAKGSKLRQTATEAVMMDVAVKDGSMPWTYAYFEIAERGFVVDPVANQPTRFEGFLGPQATNLFEMTKLKG